jgi:hypothetical protein
MRTPNSHMLNVSKIFLLLGLQLFVTTKSWGYRPFESTDADVIDAKEIEIELGYFNWMRADGENSYVTPQFVFNYGLTDRLELVAEFEVEHPENESSEFADPAVFLKSVLKPGVLQGESGLSFAIEAGTLLPVHSSDEIGVEAIGIVSGRFSIIDWHLNFGGGMDRVDHNSFALWGVIAEFPLSTFGADNLRLVGEFNGESVRGESAENSALLGLIWEPTSRPNLSLDFGVRHGTSSASDDWAATLGMSFSF